MIKLKTLLLLSFLLPALIYAQENKIKEVHATKKNIVFELNGHYINWRVSPKIKKDRYKAFCYDDTNLFRVITGIDSIQFNIAAHDTVRFNVILNKSDTALTEIAGIKEFPSTITRNDKIFFLGKLWSEAKYNFMNYDNLGFDLDSLYKSLIPEAIATKNDYEYYRILKKFYASLNDGHTQVVDAGQFKSFFDYIPITLTYTNEKIFVLGFRDEFKDKLLLGYELVRVNDKPVKEYMEQNVFPYLNASTKQWKWKFGKGRILSGLKGTSKKLTFKTPSGEYKEFTFIHNGEFTRYNRLGEEKVERIGPEFEYKKNLALEYTGDSIAILNYSAFYPENVTKQFESLLPQLYKANGLILDIRKNLGGSTGVAENLLKYIVKKDYFLGLASECKVNDAVKKAFGYGYDEYKDYYDMIKYRQIEPDTIQIPDTLKRIECPIVILTSELTFSAAEDFLIMLYELEERPLILGRPTGGSTGSPLVINGLPGGGYARICTRRCKFPISGKPFVNKGIAPDIVIQPSIEDKLKNKDVVLERGLEEIRKRFN